MIQCEKVLTVPYAIELARKCGDFNVKWIEEALPPSQQEGYVRLRETVPTISWAVGKHNYTRYDFKRLLERKSCDIVCLDVTTCGGLTEARKIVSMASAYDISVIPQGSSSIYGYHLQMACSNCPLGEHIIMEPYDSTRFKGFYESILGGEPVPSNGYIELAHDKPGFGIHLCCNKKFLKRPYKYATNGEEERQGAAQALVAAARTPIVAAPTAARVMMAPHVQPPAGIQNKVTPVKRTRIQQAKYGAQPKAVAATTRAIGFRRFLSNDTVDALSYQEAGDWCRKVGISLAGRKQERKDRLNEYLKGKPDGYKEY